jgi:phosphohistidine phosphatase
MTMTLRRLLLIRHAKSAWDRPGLDDHDRPLAPRGRRAAAALGVYLRDEGLAPDLVHCSSARRAKETWDWIQRQFDHAPALRLDRALYMAPGEAIRLVAAGADDAAATLAVIGHEGGVDALARRLARDGDAAALKRLAEAFPTAALAVLEGTLASWRDLAPGALGLARLVRPKDLV